MSVLFRAGAAEPEPEIAWLWPCNVKTWEHWCNLQTEWRSNGTGATWLDYTGVRIYFDELGLHGDERTEAYLGIRAADAATRSVWAEQRAAQEANKN